MKYCQGPSCHEHKTKDRIRGTKGSKHYETRRRTYLNYGNNFCSLMCQDDWFRMYGTRAIDHFGRIHEPIRLVPENAWIKDYDYQYNNGNGSSYSHYFLNKLTTERIPLTQAQYDDNNYTIESAR